MKRFFIAFSAVVAAVPGLTPIQSSLDLNDEWQDAGFESVSKVLKVKVVLRQQHVDQFVEKVNKLSNPKSSEYSNYLSTSEINSLLTAPAEEVAEVARWLATSVGQSTFQWAQGAFVGHLSVQQANSLFHTQISQVYHKATSRTGLRASTLYVPNAVAPLIATIYGLQGLPALPRPKRIGGVEATYAVTPAVLANTYNITVRGSGSTSVRQAVAEFQGQYMNQADLTTFFKQYVPKAQPGEEQVYAFVGNNASKHGTGVEALLDIEYIMGVAPGVKTEFWYFTDENFCADLRDWTDAIIGSDDPPLVHSVSYGEQGNTSLAHGCQDGFVEDIDMQFAKISAKGVTVLIASGDDGAGGSVVSKNAPLWPSWPGSAPHITAVGSTMFINNDPSQGEQATTQFGSGGGFSWFFDQPSYQDDAIAKFFKVMDPSKLPPKVAYPQGARGAPDMAALGEGYQVIVNGKTTVVGGTSASTPAFAGMVSLLNDARAKVGKKSMGAINQFLYQNAGAFNDITVGNNRIGTGSLQHFVAGWDCVEGWDPVTGWGTPNLGLLLEAALALP